MSDLFDELAAEASDAQTVPTEENTTRLRKMGTELVLVSQHIRELEQQLEQEKKRRTELATMKMPSLMSEIGVDRIGLAEVGVDLVIEPYYHANISKDWDDDRREAAFKYLEDMDSGDLIKSVLIITAARGDWEAMRKVAEQIDRLLADAGIETQPSLEKTVPWNTLTAFVKEQLRQGTALDLEMLGATVGSVVKIKKRKD